MNKALDDIIKGLRELKKEAVTTADGLGEVTKQNTKASKAAGELSESVQGLQTKMSQLGHFMHAISRPRGSLGTFGNKLIELANSTSILKGATTLSNPVFLAMAATAATLGGAYFYLREDTDKVAEAAKKLKERQEELNKILMSGEAAILTARSELAALSGEFTALEIAMAQSSATASRKFAKSLEEIIEKEAEAIEVQAELKTAFEQSGNTLGKEREEYEAQKKVVAELTATKGGLKAQQDELYEVLLDLAKAKIELEKIEKNEGKRTRSETKRVATLKTTMATALQVERAFKSMAEGAIQDLITEEGELTLAFLKTNDELTILETKTKKRIEGIDAQIEQAEKLNLTEEQQLELMGARHILETQLNQVGKTRFELNEQLIRQQEELTEHQEELAKGEWLKSLHEGLGAASSLATAFGDAFGASIDFIIGENENLSESQREVLMNLFNAQKAAAAGSIVISTAAAIMKALEELGPIAGAVSSAAIAITGGVQLATVLAQPPPFHTGGIVPSNGMVNALGGEAFLNRETTSRLGQEGVNALNSGEGLAGGAIQIQNVYGHRVFDRFVIDNISKGGPLASAIQGGSRVGHSTRSTS